MGDSYLGIIFASISVTGCLCVVASFPFIFQPMLGTNPMRFDFDSKSLVPLLYYAPFIVIFQIGWASTQISHLSLIPELTFNEHDRVGLNAIRLVTVATEARTVSIYYSSFRVLFSCC